jgi:hypothetical protein
MVSRSEKNDLPENNSVDLFTADCFEFLQNYNGKKFDIPTIIKNGIKQGLKLPYFKLKQMTKRYDTSKHIDLMELITDLLAILTKLVNLLPHVYPLIDILQIIQSLLKEISRV